jgi:hypothetical protein
VLPAARRGTLIIALCSLRHPVPRAGVDLHIGALGEQFQRHDDDRINQIAPERSQPRQRAILVGTGKPAVSDHIRSQNGRHGFDTNRQRRVALIDTARTKMAFAEFLGVVAISLFLL